MVVVVVAVVVAEGLAHSLSETEVVVSRHR